MKVYCNIDTLKKNIDVINAEVLKHGIKVAYMVKYQLLKKFITNTLDGEKIYTTKGDSFINIYENDDYVIVDAFDRREGLTLEEAVKAPNKNNAIVNFYCCNGKLPTDNDLEFIYIYLKNSGYKNVSFGGSMLLEYRYKNYDEIRIGEAFLTGYSTVYKRYFKGLENPFFVEIDCKVKEDIILLYAGFLEIGGFTDVSTRCVNTDFTVLENDGSHKTENGKIILKPDYYTLIKLAYKGLLDEIEIVRENIWA